MKIIGYVQHAPDSGRIRGWMGGWCSPLAHPDEHSLALVPLAELPGPVDVDAAVERAAQVAYEQRVTELGITFPDEWAALLPTTRVGWRGRVRPIVLAALGLAP